ncbi:ExbD/TolR family protein [Celeribacter sp.]|uniref:ExbD/TolR family protein n=1 Tax=Celeribacter sp. TaxID=1890673 RepID=UPI003A8DD98C
MKRRVKRKAEPTIALINVVFLMLVFFLIAGTIAPPVDPDLKLIRTADLDVVSPPDALVIGSDGTLSYRGEPLAQAADYLDLAPQNAGTVRILPDRDLDATALIKVAADLKGAGAERIVIVGERNANGEMQ